MRKKVFITDDVFTAFVDRANPRHLQAKAYFRYFAENEFILFTSPLVIEKTYQKIASFISPSIARDYLKALTLGSINTLYPDEQDLKLAFKFFQTNPNFEIGFGEALIGTLCYRHNVSDICTFSYLHPSFGVTQFYLPI